MAAKKSTKSAKKSTKKQVKEVKVIVPEVNETAVETKSMSMPTLPKLKVDPKFLAAAAILIGVGLLTYKLGPWLVPAVVDKTPITRWKLYEKLEKSYATQTLDDMINEEVLNVAIKKSGVKVDKARVDEEMGKIEKQFENLGGLDEALKTRGMTKADLVAQVTTQLSVEEILKDKITSTDEEVKKYFDENSKTIYKDKKFEDVQVEIVDTLKQSKLRDQFMVWFTEVKKDISVRNFSSVAK